MKTLSIYFILLISSFCLTAQPMSPKEILLRAEEVVKNLDAFQCDLRYINQSGEDTTDRFDDRGTFFFGRLASDTIFGGRFRLESNRYLFAYDKSYLYHIAHHDRRTDIIYKTAIEEFGNPMAGVMTPEELMAGKLRCYVDDPTSSYKIVKETEDYWLIQIEKEPKDIITEEWHKQYQISKKDFLIHRIQVSFRTGGALHVGAWTMNNYKTSFTEAERNFSHINLPLNYRIVKYPLSKAATANAQAPKYLPAGIPIPPFTLEDLEGNTVGLSAEEEGLVMLDFWEYWCGPCIRSIPKLKRLHETYAKDGLKMIGIFAERPDVIQNISSKYELSYPNAKCDEAFLKSFKVVSRPTIVLIKDGVIVHMGSGNDEDLEALIREHLGV